MARKLRAGSGRPGWVYVMTNRSMPGLVKIGMTTRSPRERARDLSGATGVPEPFEVAHAVQVSDCSAVEARLHRSLTRLNHRVNSRREFFRLSPREASRLVDEAAAAHRRRMSAATLVGRAVLAVAGAFVLALFAFLPIPYERLAGLAGHPPRELAGWALIACVITVIVLTAGGGRRRRRRRRR